MTAETSKSLLFNLFIIMEKLIVQYNVGDTYTYSATETHPVLFSSKEEFIITLEDLVLARNAERAILFVERNALFDQQIALGKKMQKNPTEAVTKEWMDMRDRSQAMCERIQALETVILGGQEFPLNEFIQGDVYSPPDVYTVDEFFTAWITQPI